MTFCTVTADTAQEWVDMAHALWPYCKKKELRKEIGEQLDSDSFQNYLARSPKGAYIGFIQISVRSDHVEGSSTSPLAYIEGIYVKPKHRKKGIARALVREAEKWAQEQGFTEIGSDTEIDNKKSRKFHKRVGFKTAGVNVHFIKKITIATLLALTLAVLPAEQLRFRYRDGERYRILSEIEQDVYINGDYLYSAELLNRIQVEVPETQGARGREEVYYQRSEEIQDGSGEPYRFGQEYSAEFWRDQFGFYDIDPDYFVPSVRNVPVFPEAELRPGDTWSAPGQEIHDFRESFGIAEAFSFTIPVSYKYIGPVRKEGIDLHQINIHYDIFHHRLIDDHPQEYPQSISGYSNQTLYFDNVLGRAHSYAEEYEFILEVSDGTELKFKGRAAAWVVESDVFNREALRRDIERQLDDLGVEDSSVQNDDRGVTIALENIQFRPDSAELLASEQDKLDKIARILSDYSDRDILVSGHTALAGSVAGRQLLSEERAKSVVEYMIEIGARDRSRILYQGFGAERPLASNSNEAGRRRNRRVEITILEN